jgi:hypothetical protein
VAQIYLQALGLFPLRRLLGLAGTGVGRCASSVRSRSSRTISVHRFPAIMDSRLFAIKLVFTEAGNEIKSREKRASVSEITQL